MKKKGWDVGREEESWMFDVDGYIVRASPDGNTWLQAGVIAVCSETFFIIYPFTTLPCVIAWQRPI